MVKILVTDGEYKQTLALLRHLPDSYHKSVITTTSKLQSICFYSRYCNHVVRLSASGSETEKKDKLIAELIKGKYDVLIPVGLNSCYIIYKYYSEISQYVRLLAPNWDDFITASDKYKTMNFASNCGVPIPETIEIKSITDLNNATLFPAVLKASGGSGGFVFYPNTKEELFVTYNKLTDSNKKGVLYQEYISGFGCGYFGLYINGVKLASYMHKRIKEYPISGGPSVVAESFYDKRLEEYGNTLCEALHWTGPIMCEFKYDSIHDDFKLIEINPKLWGSLELTIEAGVNIPNLMIQHLLGENPHPVTIYKNIRFRWILSGEFIHFLEIRPATKFSSFLHIKPNEKTDIRFDDLLSTIFLSLILIIRVVLIYIKKHKMHSERC